MGKMSELFYKFSLRPNLLFDRALSAVWEFRVWISENDRD